MNVSRLIASVGGLFYSTAPGAVAVHLYGGNLASLSVDGSVVRLRQVTGYPWSGAVRIEVETEAPIELTLKLRIPGWARAHAVRVNGQPVGGRPERNYLDVQRTWRSGDVVELQLPMTVERLYAHPGVESDVGRTCLKRGPLVYCVEEIDHPSAPVGALRLPRTATLREAARPDLFGGIVTVVADAQVVRPGDGALYRAAPFPAESTPLVANPYYLWNNRGANRMLVWLPED